MRIRQAENSDQERIGHILLTAYEPVLKRMSSTEASDFVLRIPGAVSQYASAGIWLIAEQDEPIGAVAFFAPGSTKHPLFQGNVAHIQLLGVLPSKARSGVARALLEECLSLTSTSGASELQLQTSELMLEAKNLYESLGFKTRKELPPVWGAPTFLYAKSVS
jgi:ribosomal protein S18 acetylase RimI-like enzyme